MDVSVIVVTKNEAGNIGRCIESILADTKGLDVEITVVDSRSDDGTVQIAQRYPVTVALMGADALITSDAGRYVGTHLSKGRYLCYLDGDMIVIPGWMSMAIKILEEGDVQGVAGRLFNVLPGEELSIDHVDDYVLGLTDCFGGAGVYRGDLIRAVGPFNPHLWGEGERELGFRIRKAGAKLLRADIPMVYHMVKPRTVGEIDEKAGMFAGVGQIFRRYLGQEISLSLLKAHKQTFMEIVLTWLTLASPIVLLLLGYLWAALVAAGLVLLMLVGLVLLKGPRKTSLYIRARVMNSLHIIRGFFLGLPDPGKYVLSYVVLDRTT